MIFLILANQQKNCLLRMQDYYFLYIKSCWIIYPQQNQIIMNSEENSLLGFLKKKTIFKQSPVRYVPKRSRSKSKEGKQSIIRQISDKDLTAQTNGRLFHTNSERQFKVEAPHMGFFQKTNEQMPPENSFKRGSRVAEQPSTFNKLKNPEERFDFSMQEQGNRLLAGLGAYATSFESARVESAQCLDSLSLKMKTEVASINFRLDQFRHNMSKMITSQLNALKQEILKLVDQVFKESERTMKDYMKVEEERLAADLLKVREALEKEYVHVQTMREEIAKPSWRKVTGEILATEPDKTLEELIKKSSNTEIGKWEVKNLSGQRMKALQVELRNLVKLKE